MTAESAVIPVFGVKAPEKPVDDAYGAAPDRGILKDENNEDVSSVAKRIFFLTDTDSQISI